MNAPFRRIVAAIDRCDLANAVFEQAFILAQQHHSLLILTHCTSLQISEHMGTFIDAGFGLVSPAKLQQLDEEYRDQVDEDYQWLCDYASVAQAEGVCTQVIHQVGEACVQICSLAKHSYADLIVMGRSRKLGLKQRLFGCKTDYVMRYAPCPVMVVQSESHTQYLPPQVAPSIAEQPHQADIHLTDWKPIHPTNTIRRHTWN